ncbi:MAG: hypothetical protein ACR2IP_06725 [Solirubrobacteraceae bacterium]
MPSPPPTSSHGTAQELAQRILGEHRFQAPRIPRPLHGVLHALGAALAPVAHGVKRLVALIGAHLPGGAATVWALLAGAVLVLSTLLGTRFARRALSPSRGPSASRSAAGAPRAADLERAATAAEERGELGDAVRLRFQAGLLALAEQDAIPTATGLPNAALAHVLRSESFDALARRFDEIVYGASVAEPQDVQNARLEWPELIRSSKRSRA